MRALGNLVDNAIKYTPEGGTITVKITEDTDRAQVVISDTGSGISEEALPNIFQRFFRADEHRGVGGTGLGLSITQKIIEAHGGEISVESQQGIGTTFTVGLPLVVVGEKDDGHSFKFG